MNQSAPGLPPRYSRQVQFPPIGDAGQKRLSSTRAILLGCGALGSTIADMIVRAGIGSLLIVDRDIVEESNLQRQSLFDTADVQNHTPKAIAAGNRLTRINPLIQIKTQVCDVDSGCISDLIADEDILLDGTDNFETRYLINDAAVQSGKPWIYGGVLGCHGMAAAIVPDKTPCLHCLFEEMPAPGSGQTCETVGVIAPIIHMVAAAQVGFALRLICQPDRPPPMELVQFDVWKNDYRTLDISQARNPSCPVCGQRKFSYLTAERGSFTTRICGRDAVQIFWHTPHQLDFSHLAKSLRGQGTVVHNAFVLKFHTNEMKITLFRDGRAVIEGTRDPARARELYAKYIG